MNLVEGSNRHPEKKKTRSSKKKGHQFEENSWQKKRQISLRNKFWEGGSSGPQEGKTNIPYMKGSTPGRLVGECRGKKKKKMLRPTWGEKKKERRGCLLTVGRTKEMATGKKRDPDETLKTPAADRKRRPSLRSEEEKNGHHSGQKEKEGIVQKGRACVSGKAEGLGVNGAKENRRSSTRRQKKRTSSGGHRQGKTKEGLSAKERRKGSTAACTGKTRAKSHVLHPKGKEGISLTQQRKREILAELRHKKERGSTIRWMCSGKYRAQKPRSRGKKKVARVPEKEKKHSGWPY